MSSGSILHDFRSNQTLGCGPAQPGLYYSKIWSGGDSFPDLSQENQYDCSILSFYDPIIEWSDNGTTFYSGTYRSCFGGASGVQLWSTNDDIVLLSRLSENVRGHSFDAGIFVAEGRKSLDMISHRTASMIATLKAVKHGDISSLRSLFPGVGKSARQPRTQKDLSRLFLEFEYGWRPLVKDIYEGSSAVFSIFNRPLSRTYSAGVKVNGYISTAAWGFTVPGTCFTSKRARVRLSENYSPWTSLGLTDPAIVAWELLPYSFVADWVIPIGQFLQARRFLNDINGAPIWVSEFSREKVSTLKVHPSIAIRSEYPYQYGSVRVKRGILTAALPSPKVKDFNKIFSFRRCLDSIALMMNRFGSRKLIL